MLSVGTIQPRKNIGDARGRFRWLRRGAGSPTIEHVHAGGEGWLCQQVYAAIEQAGDRVRFVGRVDDRTLRALYSLASVYAYPSHGEGFGIPILEAFACGCPVLTSDTPATTEVAAGAAVTVDPSDPEALADGLITLLTDESRRAELIEFRTQAALELLLASVGTALAGRLSGGGRGPPEPIPSGTTLGG